MTEKTIKTMTEENVTGKTSTKIVPAQRTKVSNEKTKNESVVGRNIFQRAMTL